MADATAGSVSVEALAEEFLERKRRGEHPAVAEYLARYPHLAEEIRDVFPVLGLVEDFKPGSGDATGSFGGGEIPGLEQPLLRLGDFRILRVVGRGGMGVVYEAEQESLGRRVALKVMSGHRLSDINQLVRFTREAKAAARLHHTNIVPVFGVGQEEGVHYYVMQFIQGQGLDAVLGELRRLEKDHEPPTGTSELRPGEISAAAVAQSLIAGRFSGLEAQTAHDSSVSEVSSGLPSSDALRIPGSSGSSLVLSGKPAYARSAARIGLQAAEGLAYAHEQGILHRDVKPSNLLLDAHGIVWITDFGLAKATTDSDLTHTGDIIGTVRYMAPERFHGHCDARSDVYALGLTLYELLAQRPAFDEADRGKLIRQVTDTEPAPLRKLDRTIPRDLATIVHKAIEREPAHRYGSAEDLVADLRRFLEDRPITARQVTASEQLWRWCKRNPLAAALSASLLATLVGGLLVVSVLLLRLWAVADERGQLYRAERQRSEQLREASARANAETRTARTAEELANRRLYIARMNQMARLWEEGNGRALFQTLAEQLPENQAGVERRGWEWYYWQRKATSGHITLKGHTTPVWKVRFSPDGTRLASVGGVLGKSGEIKLWDAATGHETLNIDGKDLFYDVAFSPEGSRIATAGADKLVRVWDAKSRQELLICSGHTDRVLGVAFSPSGTRIASFGAEGTVRVWDARSGDQVFLLSTGFSRDTEGRNVAFSPDGTLIASGGGDRVKLWDSATGQEKRELTANRVFPLNLSFSPDRAHLATGDIADGSITVWDLATGREKFTTKAHTWVVWEVAYSPDGSRIAFCNDQMVRVFDAGTGKELLTFRGHTDRVNGVSFSPDGTRVASASFDQTVKIWEIGGPPATLTLKGHAATPFLRAAFSPDGTRIASAGYLDGTLRLWDSRTGMELLTLRHDVPVCSIAFSPDNTRLATAGFWTVHVYDLATGIKALSLEGHAHRVMDVAFNSKGTMIASADADNAEVKLWDAATGRLVRSLKGDGFVFYLAFSPDGSRIAAGSGNNIKIWDVATSRVVFTLTGHEGDVLPVAFSPDGTLLASASHDQTVRIWSMETGRQLHRLAGHGASVLSVAFGPGGSRIASGSQDGSVKVWDTATGQELLSIKGAVFGAFSPDGSRMASAHTEEGLGLIEVWDAGEATPESRIREQALSLVHILVDRLGSEAEVRDRITRDKTRSEAVRAAALGMVHGFWQMRFSALAEEIVGPLVDRLLLRDDVLAALKARPHTDPEIQSACLKLAETWSESSGACNDAAWTLVREPARSAASYQRALRLAEVACRLQPGNGAFVNTLGVAQYRAGLVTEALATLTHSNALQQGKEPADLAFLAMARQRLGQTLEARAMLDRLRELMRPGHAASDPEGQDRAFLAEAEAVVLYDPMFPADPFSR